MQIISPNDPSFDSDLLSAVSRNAIKYTIPTFCIDDSNMYRHNGTAILLKVNTNYFIISAAHVLKICSKGNFVLIEKTNRLISLKEKDIKYSANRDGIIDKEFDIAFCRIEDDEAKEFEKENQFLRTHDVNPIHESQSRFHYIIVGYPHSKVSIYGENIGITIKYGESFECCSKPPKDEVYKQTGLSKSTCILIHYKIDRDNFSRLGVMLKQGPNPLGISGCGLWHIPEPATNNIENPRFKLVGILTDYYPKYNVMIATKIEFIMDKIKELYGVED